MEDWIFKNLTSKFANRLEINAKDEKGEVRISPRNFAYFPNEGNIVYRKIPKDLSEEIKPNENHHNFSSLIKYAKKEEGALLMAISCFKGAYTGSVHRTDFVSKIENGQAKFSGTIMYDFQDLCPSVIDLRKNMIAYDFEQSHMFQKEFEAYEKARDYVDRHEEVEILRHGSWKEAMDSAEEYEMRRIDKEKQEGTPRNVKAIDLNFR